jgi:heme-degrading monooxygenase HmoA
MPFVSITRLRVRALRFMPAFFFHAIQANRQAQYSPGFLGGSLLPDRRRAFWTLTLWDSEPAMRNFMMSGSHRAVMPKLLEWCDEASVTHWEQGERSLPSWEEAARRMRNEGRPSKVRHPSPAHQSLAFDPPRTTGAAPITARIRK